MYRFLATPKWIGFAVLMIAMSLTMVGLSDWQLHRYHERHGINVRISDAKKQAPVPMTTVMSLAHPLPSDQEWVRVTATGTYAPDKTVVARERTVDDGIGFEIVTPLVLADGSAVLIDRGWISGDSGGSTTLPHIPPVPAGTVTVTGRVHLPESKPDRPVTIDGQPTVRRIAPASVAPLLGYPRLYPDYVLLDEQTPAAAGHFTKIPADTQPAWMNAGYTVQWAAFAILTLIGYGWAARREARDRRDGVTRGPREPRPRGRDRVPVDRVPADRVPADRVPADRVPADRVPADPGPQDRVPADVSLDRVAVDPVAAVPPQPGPASAPPGD